MAVLERPELQASPLADLHAIADQLGLDGFRRLRKAELIDAILGGEPDGASAPEREAPESSEPEAPETSEAARSRRRAARAPAGRRRRAGAAAEEEGESEPAGGIEPRSTASAAEPEPARGRGRAKRGGSSEEEPAAGTGASIVEGTVELLGNGSAFLRLHPPEPSDDDVYISAAQVRRCELVSGDRVSGPARTPRRSERYPSLVRVEEINGASADAVSDGSRYDDLPVAYPSEAFALDSKDATLKEIAKLAPLGKGSRAVIVGAARSGKTETLRRLLGSLSGQGGLDVTLVLAGSRPEEIGDWQAGPVQPSVALTFAASADAQGQAVEQAVEVAKRVAVRKGHAVLLIDGLDGVHPHAARKALVAARNLGEGGSLTIVATATRPFGGETTVIALDPDASGPEPRLDAKGSGTIRPELLLGDG